MKNRPLSFDKWKKKYIYIEHNDLQSFKERHGLTEEQLEKEVDYMIISLYEKYIKRFNINNLNQK